MVNVEVEISRSLLIKVGVLVLICIVAVFFLFFWHPVSSIQTPPTQNVTSPQEQQLANLTKSLCTNKELLIKYEQDPSSTNPLLAPIKIEIGKYNSLSGAKFSSSLCD